MDLPARGNKQRTRRDSSYATLRYSRAAIDKAGKSLALLTSSEEEVSRALDVLANWRSSHAFPLNSMTMDLKQKVKRVNPQGLVAQRLKRAKSIVGKLLFKPSMRLTQMQDIGGCRAIVGSLEDVYKLKELYLQSRSLHEIISQDDYIAHPKTSGYRGLHLVFRFKSRSHPEYDRLLFEVQLRTFTQHAWATAVETVGAIIGQALKSSEGQAEWLEYFKYAALALEFSEPAPFASIPPFSKGDVARSLASLDESLQVHAKLTAYGEALRATERVNLRDTGYFLLVLTPGDPGRYQPELKIFSYSKRNADLAYKEYERYERLLPLYPPDGQLSLFPDFANASGAQAVLVGAESFKTIRDSFPNYYLDTRSFLTKIDAFVKENKRRR
ncbi:RelA/SpoT domain-containing protein [Luteibacter aegosomatis]|uniref:RelA/SpoT domain-containing protein n=1 Tax=Luteibacter aegosomatis TaxID=2911537 RepID=UPI001FF8C77C|nr:RelA/SpoT domain-containing protein [Luteibacter aegosomatis]UPG86384.1 RelA/SpoT domain-containing protein [Luteibacter aegosomatis]